MIGKLQTFLSVILLLAIFAAGSTGDIAIAVTMTLIAAGAIGLIAALEWVDDRFVKEG